MHGLVTAVGSSDIGAPIVANEHQPSDTHHGCFFTGFFTGEGSRCELRHAWENLYTTDEESFFAL